MKRLAASVCFAALLAAAAPARAEDTAAQDLKMRGHQAMVDMNYGDALELYRRALERSPADASLRYNIGRAHQAREEYPEALDALEEFARSAPAEVRAKVPKLDALVEDIRARVALVSLECTADVPDGVVVLGNRQRVTGCGRAPKSLRVGVPSRREEVDVRLESQAFQAQPTRAVLEGGGRPIRIALSVAPKATSGTLRVRATPASAAILVDDVARGNPPLEVLVKAGAHVVKVSADRHEDARVPILVEAGRVKDLDLKLERTPPLTARWWFWTAIGVAAVGAGALTWYLIAQPESEPGSGTIPPNVVRAPLVF